MSADRDIEDLEVESAVDDERLRDAIRDKNAFSTLVHSPAWVRLMEILDDQIKARQHEVILKPMESLLDLPKVEYMKGEIASLMLVKELPHTQLEAAQSVIDSFRQKFEEDRNAPDNSDRNDSDSDSGGGDADDADS